MNRIMNALENLERLFKGMNENVKKIIIIIHCII